MLALTLRGLAARKLRTALTAVAVVLGVALIAGTFVLTDTIDRSFDRIFETGTSGFQVAISPREAVVGDFQQAPPMSEALVARAQRVEGVRRAVGSIFSLAVIYDREGERLTSTAPNFIVSAQPPPFDPFRYARGRPPRGPGEVAVDVHTAREHGFRLGGRVRVSGDGPARTFRVVGIARYGTSDSLASAAVAVMTLPEAQRMAGKLGEVDSIAVTARPGVAAAVLRDRLREALPRTVTVRTARAEARSQAADVQEGFGFLRTALLVFAGVALFVGGFMIFNTFSITVAQRTREFGMLRTLGASRRQVRRSVVTEAALIGVVASALGLAAGIGLAPALHALFSAFGVDLPDEGSVVRTRTVVVALVTGTLVTVASSLPPAIRATRVPPVAALREGPTPSTPRARRARSAVGTVVAAIGLAVMVGGLVAGGDGTQVLSLLGAGAVAMFVGVAMLSSRLVAPLAAAVGVPLERARGLTGRLARENSVRNPGRTAITAAALMVGLALVTLVTILAAGTRGSVEEAVDRGVRSPIVIQSTAGFGSFSAAVDPAVSRVPGVRFATPLRFAESRVAGVNGSVSVTALDPGPGSRVFHVQWKRGSQRTLAGLGPRDAVADAGWARDNGFKVGERIPVTTPRSTRVALTIRGLYEDRLDFGGDYMVPVATLGRDYGVRQNQLTLVELAPGAREGRVQRRIARLLDARFPDAEALSRAEFKDDQSRQLNQLVGLIYVLLSLSVIVSLFGIVNTLALSIHERTRELGMLRAIGTSRRQVRQIVRYESVITALIGAVLGTALGSFFAFAISRPLEEQGFELSFPVGTLALLLVLAAVAGVLAAIGPARRAARLDVLEALAYE